MNQDCRLPNTKRPFGPGGGDTPAPPGLPGEKTAQLRLAPGTTGLDRVLGGDGIGRYVPGKWIGRDGHNCRPPVCRAADCCLQ